MDTTTSQLLAFRRYGHTGRHNLAASVATTYVRRPVVAAPAVTLESLLTALFPTGRGDVADVATVTRLWTEAQRAPRGQLPRAYTDLHAQH